MTKIDVFEAKISVEKKEILYIQGQINNFIGRKPTILINLEPKTLGLEIPYEIHHTYELGKFMQEIYEIKKQIGSKYHPRKSSLEINITSEEAIVD